MEDWAALPTDLLMLIAEKLYSTKEFVCFGVVCKAWFLATSTLKKVKNLVVPKLPCLMLVEGKYDEKNAAFPARGFFNLSDKKICELELTEISGKPCWGVNYGWLFTLGYDLQSSLFHPFSRDQISLPSLLPFNYHYDILTPKEVVDGFITKVALSAHPKQRECVVMAIYGEVNSLAFSRPGDELWTNAPVPFKCYEDVVYYKGQFYAVDNDGVVIVCDIDGQKSAVITPPPVGIEYYLKMYLVESSGDLLLITIDDEDDITNYARRFSILKMEKCSEKGDYPYCWVQMGSLGDRTLFIGRNTSMSLSASEYNGCFKANCIYFTEDRPGLYAEGPEEAVGSGKLMGIFDIENGTIKPHYDGSSHSFLYPPVWII